MTRTQRERTIRRAIPVSIIHRDPNQPREHFDEAKILELAHSLASLGQLQDCTVRPHPEKDGEYMLVIGERRWRAANLINANPDQFGGVKIEKLNCTVLNVQDGDPKILARAVAENVGREKMTALEEAKAFDRLRQADYSIEEIARMCGKSPAFVGWRLDLLKLELPLKEALSKEQLPVNLAWYVAQLSPDNQVRFLSKWVKGEIGTPREAEAFAKQCIDAEKKAAEQGAIFVLADGGTDQDGEGGAQDSLVSLDLPADERERIETARKQLESKLNRLAKAAEILAELAAQDPNELATVLAGLPGGIHGCAEQIKQLRNTAGKAVTALRQAEAAAAVRAASVRVNPDAIAPGAAQEA